MPVTLGMDHGAVREDVRRIRRAIALGQGLRTLGNGCAELVLLIEHFSTGFFGHRADRLLGQVYPVIFLERVAGPLEGGDVRRQPATDPCQCPTDTMAT